MQAMLCATPGKAEEIMNEQLHTCHVCGHTWATGQSGEHRCSDLMGKEIDRLKKEVDIERDVLQLLIVAGYVTQAKADEARNLLRR